MLEDQTSALKTRMLA